MKVLSRIVLSLTVTVGVSVALLSAPQPPAKLKGLMIAGGCCHDYAGQTKLLTEELSKRISITWTIVRGPDGRKHKLDVYKNADWAKKYDVIVHNECYGGVDDVEFVKRITEAHRNGTPGVVIHCSMHSYRAAPTDEWRKCLGVTSRRHERHRAVDVENLAPKHPIMIGFPEKWRTPKGELYVIEKVWPTAKPLAKAYGQDTKKDHVVIWANQYGKGRVFGTTLGHHNVTMAQKEYLDLVARGLLWACSKLREDGNPEDGFAAPKKS